MPELQLNGARYHVSVEGRGAPLLLLHGFTGSGASWRGHFPALTPQRQVIAPDLLGHGRTEAPADPARYAMGPCVADVIALLDQLGLGAVDVLGYSMGGRVALSVAAAHPARIRRLVLESASPGLATAEERAARRAADEALAARLEQEGLEAFVDAWERLPLFASQAQLPAPVRAAVRAQRLAHTPAGLANSLRGLGTGAQPALWDRLPDLRRPVLLVAGALDAKFVGLAQAMAARLPLAELRVIAQAGHTVHLEQPEAYAEAVLRFLNS